MNVVDMSERRVTEVFMAGLLDEDLEGWARLQGLLAVMGLPPVREVDGFVRRRVVEIEIRPNSDLWVAIEGIAIEMHRVICWTGTNGSKRQYEFVRGEDMPRWRVPSMSEHALPNYAGHQKVTSKSES